jgi:hypothetical protein
MFYTGPTQSDYVNIQALNREFLKLLQVHPIRFGLKAIHQRRLAVLGRKQLEQLAATPFLLFTIQENDELTWRAICRADPNTDLFENGATNDAGISNLLATSVGYLWQLAQQNPYSVRLICGASPAWCEMITAVTYFELLTLTRYRDDLLVLRQAQNVDIWSKLLAEGVRAEQHVRSAAHIAALQTLLTGYPGAAAAAWPVAACKAAPRFLRVADESEKGTR